MQIAKKLGCVLMMLPTENIDLPHEPIPVGGMTLDGTFSYNHNYTDSEIDGLVSEYRGVIEQEKLSRINSMHRASSEGTRIKRELLEKTTVILVSDGFKDGISLRMKCDVW